MSINIPNLEKNKILAPFTTYKIGGHADLFVEVYTVDDMVNAVLERAATVSLFSCLDADRTS